MGAPIRPSGIEELVKRAGSLVPGQVDLLIEMANAMSRPVENTIATSSDVVSKEFAENFGNRLLLHHATTFEKFRKKPFEYAFVAASRSAGKPAELVESATYAGADVVVDGIKYSLKTEASSHMKEDRLSISKFSEARWIRECKTKESIHREATERIAKHLTGYDRILMLRGFDGENASVKYSLIEIPVKVLAAVSSLRPGDFSSIGKNGGSTANVLFEGSYGFALRLDGSVEKITISNLSVKHCLLHASWVVPASRTDE